jgi:hypothetical protein
VKKDFLLVLTSVLSIFFLSIHLACDIVLGMEKGGPLNLVTLPILTLWLYGSLVPAGSRWGYIIMLIGSTIGLAMPIIHMKGAGISSEVVKHSGAFLFVWTLISLGVTSLFSLVLSSHLLWKLQRTTHKVSNPA